MFKMTNKLLVLLFVFKYSYCYIVDPGPAVIATKGAVWPKPQEQQIQDGFFTIKPNHFMFHVLDNDCDILEQALQRYWHLLGNQLGNHIDLNNKDNLRKIEERNNWLGVLNTLDIILETECSNDEYPKFEMNEQYILVINETVTQLIGNSIWGVLRGLETFSQLVHLADDETTLILNATMINDHPRFPHRGLLLDTSRHYIPVKYILETLDAMAYNKLNVFHWHITDDQSFPYVSIKFPELHKKGAYHPELMIYTVHQIEKVIEYARVRGIRVLAEFDTPGHTRSWGEGMPELLTECFGKYVGKYGPMNPSRNFVYSFLKEFFDEVTDRFPDKYIHLGGDEVGFECWESNPDINNFMASLNITGDYKALESYYIQKLVNIIHNMTIKTIVWEEVFDNGVKIPNTTIVHVWRDGYANMMERVTKAGYLTLLSSCWYLDHLESGGDWRKFYDCDPYNFNGTLEQKKLILGGEACMWDEFVNEQNVISRVWPRASAAAEKLWSKLASTLDLYDVAKRIEEHTCRMNKRGLAAQPPNGPGFCL